MQNYELMFMLSSFIDSKIIEVENDEGEMEEGIFIPIAKNALSVDPKKKFVTSWCYVTEKPYKTWSHYLRMKVDRDTKQRMIDLGIELPYMGNMRVNNKFMYYNKYNNNGTKAANALVQNINEEDE